MIGLLRMIFLPVILAWSVCMGLWNWMTDLSWNIYVRLLVAGSAFLGVAVLLCWWLDYF